MTIELYHSPFSTCSQKVRLCLAEKNVEYIDCRISFAEKEHLTEEYLAINPNGVVPAIVHNGRPVIDSSVICEYLDEVYPEPRLSGADALERAKVRAWLRFLEEVPTAAIRIPSFNELFSQHLRSMGEEEFNAHAARLPIRKHFYQKMTDGKFSDTERQAALERLATTLDRIESALESGPWIIGDFYSLVDIVAIPTVVRMEDIGLAHMWDCRPKIEDWLDRVKSRPSFAVAFFPGSRITPDGYNFEQAENLEAER